MNRAGLKERVGALIIEDGRLLLVTDVNQPGYWTPGGRVEAGESREEALRRELDEELGITPVRMQSFAVIDWQDLKLVYYIVEYDGEPKPQNEVAGFRWFERGELEDEAEAPVTAIMREGLLPLLWEGELL